MIFILRLVIFSFLILLGFHLSLQSKKGRAVVSVIYAVVLLYYTFLCRLKITVDVAASDYPSTSVTLTTGEKVLQLLKQIFGMDSSGQLVNIPVRRSRPYGGG